MRSVRGAPCAAGLSVEIAIRFDNNKCSGGASAVGCPGEMRVYADRIPDQPGRAHRRETSALLRARGRNPWTIWQFTDHATLPGVDKPVELNVFFGNEEQFSSFVKGEGNIGLSAAEKLR
jgi:hypothetical protein